MRKFQYDYIIASGYEKYEFIPKDKNDPSTFEVDRHRFTNPQGDIIYVREDGDNSLSFMSFRRADEKLYINSLGNTYVMDDIVTFAMGMHAIGAINLRSNFLKAGMKNEPFEF